VPPWGLIAAALVVVAACAPAPSAERGAAPAPAEPARAPSAPSTQPEARPASAAVRPLNPPVKVRAGTQAIAPEAAVFIALEKGYFAEEGLEVELTRFRTGSEQVAALALGELHFASSGLDPSLFNAVLRDIELKLVASNAVVNADDHAGGLIVRRDLLDSGQYRELRDLRGRTVATNNQGTSAQVYLEHALAKAGLTVADVQLAIVSFPDMGTALANRAIDAAWAVEPFIAINDEQGISRAVVTGSDLYLVGNVLMMSPSFAREQPEAARRFVTAHVRGQRDYYSAFVQHTGSEDEIVQILIKHTGVKDPALYARMGHHGVDPNSAIEDRAVDVLQDHFLRYGTQQGRVDLSKLIDRTYLNYAWERLGRLP
jgi:NitT/TauT family transport system substrate-binding protein